MNKYDYFFLSGLILWLVETMAFGWNESSKSVPETMLNFISIWMAAYGTVGGIASAVKTTVNVHSKETVYSKETNQ